jgi:hypothetical protein
MRRTADMLRTFRKRRLGMLFSIVTGLVVSLTVTPARATDLALPTDEKILQALKAKRLTRCPHAGMRLRCGGARLHNPPPKGRAAMSKSPWMTAAPRFRARAISFAARFGNQVFDPAERVRVTAASVCSGAAPEAWRGAVVLEDGGLAGFGGCRLHPQLAGRDRPQRLHAIHHGGSVSADYCEWLTPLIRDIERGKITFRRLGPHDVRGGCVLRYANGRFSANLT